MPKKLTKDQKYNRKRRKDGNKDFRKVHKEGGFDGVRVTRRQITFYVSNEASERLTQMARNAGITKWEMATRIILKGLPGIEASGYARDVHQMGKVARYEWNVLYLEPINKRIHYRSGKADKRITMDITSTAWNKIHCHSTATERSMSQIFQSLCLNYRQLTPEQLEKAKHRYEEYIRSFDGELSSSRYYKPYDKPEKFIDAGWDLIHVKGISPEYWDMAEFEEYETKMQQKIQRHREKVENWDNFVSEMSESLESDASENSD